MTVIAADRARRHTARSVLRRIDGVTVDHLAAAIDRPESVGPRLAELDAEWDLDRTIETEAAVMGLVGLALGTFVNRKFLVLPAAVGTGVLLFGWFGVYPLLPLFRRLHIRTGGDIQRERYALKALRGDFAELPTDTGPKSPAPMN